jgi:HSP20 family protein
MTISTFPQLALHSSWERLLKQAFTDDYMDDNYPFTDVYSDEEGDTIIECALAGFSKDYLSIETHDNKVTISGSFPENSKVIGDRRISRRAFKKSYVDTTGVLDLSSAKASFTDGLLKVKIPKAEKAKKKTVTIG